MAGTISESWSIWKASGRLINADRKLVLFPALATVTLVGTAAVFLAPEAGAIRSGLAHGVTFDTLFNVVGEVSAWVFFDPHNLALVFVFYLTLFGILYFFNSALVASTLRRLDEGETTVRHGLAIALRRLRTVLGFAVLSATYGVLPLPVQSLGGWFSESFMGRPWSLATYLAFPILVTRHLGVRETVEGSAALLGKAWGERAKCKIDLRPASIVIDVAWTFVSVCMIALTRHDSSLLLGAVCVAVSGYLGLTVMMFTVRAIYSVALYRYATTEGVEFFDRPTLADAFGPRM